MSYTKATFTTALQGLAVVQPSDSDFAAILNSPIHYAEQRIYRELDCLATVVRDKLTLTPNVRELDVTANVAFVTIQQVAVMTGLSPADTLNSKRNLLSPVSRDILDAVYGAPVPVGQPKWFCMLDDTTIMVGPAPDLAYPVEIVGTKRPAPLYSLGDDDTTFLTSRLPDLFMAAAMIFVTSYQKNFGAQADDPKMANSWESQYQTLMASASTEEARRKMQASGWTSLSQPAAATASR